MKHLYIRYFRNEEDTMPANSDKISNKDSIMVGDLKFSIVAVKQLAEAYDKNRNSII